MILACQNIEKSFDGELLLHDVNFHIEEREKAALIGINGAGKSTLLKIIVGEISPDEGQVILAKGKTIGYLAQHQEISSQLSIYDSLLEMKQHVLDMERGMRELEEEMKHAEGKIYPGSWNLIPVSHRNLNRKTATLTKARLQEY